MSNRTWACIPCRKTFRRIQTEALLSCPQCGAACEFVDWKMRVPPTRNVKRWIEFWNQYRQEKRTLQNFHEGTLKSETKLELLNMMLHVETRSHTAPQQSERKWKAQKRRSKLKRGQ